MIQNKSNKIFKILRIAIAGSCGLIGIKVFDVQNLWGFVTFLIIFGIVSTFYDIYINLHIKRWDKKQIRNAKLISWIIFILLVVIISYLNTPKEIYIYNLSQI